MGLLKMLDTGCSMLVNGKWGVFPFAILEVFPSARSPVGPKDETASIPEYWNIGVLEIPVRHHSTTPSLQFHGSSILDPFGCQNPQSAIQNYNCPLAFISWGSRLV